MTPAKFANPRPTNSRHRRYADDARERYHLAVARACVELRQVLGARTELLVRLDVDAVGAVVELEIVHVGRAQERLHRGRDLAQRHAGAQRPLPIDADHELRIVRGERREDAAQQWRPGGGPHDAVGAARERADVGARLIEHLDTLISEILPVVHREDTGPASELLLDAVLRRKGVVAGRRPVCRAWSTS